MRLKYRLFVLCVVISSFFNEIYSQAHLSFGYNGVNHEDTVSYGDSIFYSFWIVNSGNVSFNDSIQLTCETYNSSGLINMGSFGMFSTPSGVLNPGDSIYFNVFDIITPQSYTIGDNIVVIWPASIVPVSVDTSFTPLYVINNIVSNNNFSSSFELYPNPIRSNFNIKSFVGKIQSLIILDITGREVIREDNLNCISHNINTRNIISGLYILMLRTEDKDFTTNIVINK